jgi:hypothetical protein
VGSISLKYIEGYAIVRSEQMIRNFPILNQVVESVCEKTDLVPKLLEWVIKVSLLYSSQWKPT